MENWLTIAINLGVALGDSARCYLRSLHFCWCVHFCPPQQAHTFFLCCESHRGPPVLYVPEHSAWCRSERSDSAKQKMASNRVLVQVISVLVLEAFLWNLWIEMANKTHYKPATQLLESSLWRVEQQLHKATSIGLSSTKLQVRPSLDLPNHRSLYSPYSFCLSINQYPSLEPRLLQPTQ